MSENAGTTCPKCQYPRAAEALECPACGVVFAKLAARPPLPPPGSPPPSLPADEAAVNPYAAPRAPVLAVEAPGALVEGLDASRWMRLLARFVDSLFVGIVPALGYFIGIITLSLKNNAAVIGGCVVILLSLLLGLGLWIYNLVRQARTGQTVGKKLCNVKVVRMHGEPPTADYLVWRREIVFALIGAIPLIGPLISLADILVIFGAESRCLHDQLADTRVIDVSP